MAAASLVTFVQNLGCTISLPDINLPPVVKNALSIFNQLFSVLGEWFPGMPQFDVRTQLVLTGLIIPFALDIVIVWLFANTFDLLIHVGDLVVLFIVFLFTSKTIFQSHAGVELYISAAAGAVYFIVRIIIACIARARKVARNIEFYDLAGDVCDFHLAGILPDVSLDEKVTLEELNKEIAGYSTIIAVSNNKLEKAKLIGRLLLVLFFGYFSLACSGSLPAPFEIPAFLQLFFPYLGYPLAIIILFIALLGCCQCGRNLTLKFNQFLRRWGLRLLMFVLTCLYIPIITALLSILLSTGQHLCPAGEFPVYVNLSEVSILRPFVVRETVCERCAGNWSDLDRSHVCAGLCSGADALRLLDDPHLLLGVDIRNTCVPLAIFVIGAIMIGIPVLYSFIIRRNSRFLELINVYGIDIATKWSTLLGRLKTTGNFLFVEYKHSHLTWSVWLIVQKFLIMIFVTLTHRVLVYCVVGLPIVYAGFTVVTGLKRPYNFNGQNVLDCICFSANCLYSLIPVFAFSGLAFPSAVMIPLTISMAVLPFVFVVFIFLWKRPPFLEDDPTLLEQLEVYEQEHRASVIADKVKERRAIERHLRKLRSRQRELKSEIAARKRRRIGNSYADDRDEEEDEEEEEEEDDPEEELLRVQQEIERVSENELLRIEEDEWPFIFEEDMIQLQLSAIASILDTRIAAISSEFQPLLEVNREIPVNKRRLAKRMDEMYKTLDLVLDGSTIETIVAAVNRGMLLGALAFGWFVGSLMALDVPETYGDFNCR